MSSIVENVRAKLKRRVSHKDPEPNFDVNDDDDVEWDEETGKYVNKEVEETEKEGERYPLGRPNSFLNRMISHGNKKTEDEIARDAALAREREEAQRVAASQGQQTQTTTAPTTSNRA